MALREYTKIEIWRYAKKGDENMYPNLLGQKAYHHLTDEEMGQVIGVSRNAYSQKIRSGRFWPNECQAYCRYFKKPFDYLFATDEDLVGDTPANRPA